MRSNILKAITTVGLDRWRKFSALEKRNAIKEAVQANKNRFNEKYSSSISSDQDLIQQNVVITDVLTEANNQEVINDLIENEPEIFESDNNIGDSNDELPNLEEVSDLEEVEVEDSNPFNFDNIQE